MKFTESLAPNFSVYLGKWFTPGIGTRIAASGFKIKGLTQNGSHSTGERYDGKPWEGYWLDNQEFNYYQLHGDVLFNLNNLFSGYRSDRFYEISPYVGLGLMITNNAPKARELSANLGVFNTFRLGKAVNLTLDVRSNVVNDRFDGEPGKRKEEGSLAALIGLQIKLNKRDWDRPEKVTVVQRSNVKESDLAALRTESDKLRKEIDLLHKQLAEAGNKTVTDVKVERGMLAAPLLVTFPINQSTVGKETRVNLGFFAKVIKQTDANVVYRITGYADKGTGTAATNERLSRARAKAIYNVLVDEFGISKDQLTTDHKGGVDDMFYSDPRLSRAVITIAEEK
jgi:outer membrane protein OmpA-like peptidoglycan-associated protein